MPYVYLLRPKSDPGEQDVGCPTDLKQRLLDHNRGHSPRPAKFIPWQLVICVAFQQQKRAAAFKKRSKSGSGRAFAKRHFH